jgi:hypothetical protein
MACVLILPALRLGLGCAGRVARFGGDRGVHHLANHQTGQREAPIFKVNHIGQRHRACAHNQLG